VGAQVVVDPACRNQHVRRIAILPGCGFEPCFFLPR
jgi:hypothetical protein